jgi:hypothetical protein
MHLLIYDGDDDDDDDDDDDESSSSSLKAFSNGGIMDDGDFEHVLFSVGSRCCGGGCTSSRASTITSLR